MSETISTDVMHVKTERLEGDSLMGLRQNWIHGDNADQLGVDDLTEGKPEIEFDLDAGAGLGSPYLWMSVRITKSEETVVIRERVDMRQVCTAWVHRIKSSEEEA